ncbi:MAG: DUF3054 domain-containing protein [Bowdeniella nasicola]|nr:DUF3054 domain-containing protein [Bowdeniella nasicola]
MTTADQGEPRPIGASSDPRVTLAVALDTVAVLSLAVIGRAAHAESLGILSVLETAAPFLAGTYITHLLAVRYWPPMSLSKAGPAVWAGTWALGMVGRLMMGQTNAGAFMAITAAYLGVTIIGWRAIASIRAAKRRR